MLIKYHNMFILAAEVIKIIKERSALTMIINSDEKDSLIDKLNLTAIKSHTELYQIIISVIMIFIMIVIMRTTLTSDFVIMIKIRTLI